MKLTVIQPGYFPAIDQAGKMLSADVVVWADTFNFHKHGNFNRTRIKTIAGPKWLTIPVYSKQGEVRKLVVDNHESWQDRHFRSIELNYKNAAYYYYWIDSLKEFYTLPPEMLEPFLFSCLQWTRERLHMSNRLVKASELPVVTDRNKRVVDWCNTLDCDEYVMEPFETKLLNIEDIQKRGVNTSTCSVKTLNYFQQYEEFYFPLSILDLLFNEGESAKSMLEQQVALDVVESFF